MALGISLVLILVSEGLLDSFCDGLAMEDEAFGDRRLWIKNHFSQIFQSKKKKNHERNASNLQRVKAKLPDEKTQH